MGATTTLSDTSRGLTGQWNSITAATSSAYQKTTGAITGIFATAKPGDPNDPTSMASKVESIGPEVYVAYGQVCETTGKFSDAMENYNKALAIAPNNAPALASIARLHDRQNNHAQAIECYQKAIAATPNDAQLYNDLGMLYSRTGKTAEACEKLEQAIAIAPSESKFQNNLAAVQLDSGKADQAMATLQKANTPAAANYNMALLLVQRNQLPAAQQHLTAALQQDPNMQPARDLLTKIGGSQTLQQTYNTYQTASSVYQAVRDLSTTAPAGGNMAPGQLPQPQGIVPTGSQQMLPAGTAGASAASSPTVTGELPPLPYVPSLEPPPATTTYR